MDGWSMEIDMPGFDAYSGRFRREAEAVHRLARMIRPYNESNTVYPKELADAIRPLYDEYLSLSKYSGIVDHYRQNPSGLSVEEERRIGDVDVRLLELRMLGIKENLLNPHKEDRRSMSPEKKGLWQSLFG